MDQAAFSAELAELRGELERLRLDVGRTTSLRRQLEAVQQQLRRAQEALERRDVIIREARRQIASLSRDVETARREAFQAKDALAVAKRGRWFALREATRWAGKRPWRWLLIPIKVMRYKAPPRPEKTSVEEVPTWEPSPPKPTRPSVPRAPSSLRIGAVVGSQLRATLEPECTLATFGPDRWQEVLEDASPHIVLVESDPYANDGGWQGRLLPTDGAPDELRSLTAWCKAHGIATVFWNTSDPAELDRWLATAALFDHVMTVDADSVARYAGRGVLTMTNLGVLPAGVQPRIFGSGSAGRAARACFVLTAAHLADARAWNDIRELLTSVRDVGLDVYASSGVDVPQPFSADARVVREPLSSIYRRYAVVLSGPAAGDVKGKVPQRVLEMLASGAVVVARATPDVSLHLGSVVTTASNGPDAVAAVQELLRDDSMRMGAAQEGVAFVLRDHTATHRVASIASAVGIAVDAEADRRVAALVLADHAGDADVALRRLSGEPRPPDEVIIGTKSNPSEVEKVTNVPGARVRTVKQNGDARPERLRELARMASTPWVWISSNERPSSHPLEILVLRAPYVDADVIGWAPGQKDSDTFSDAIDLNTAIATRRLVAERGWPEDVDTLRRWSREGVRIYGVEQPASG